MVKRQHRLVAIIGAGILLLWAGWGLGLITTVFQLLVIVTLVAIVSGVGVLAASQPSLSQQAEKLQQLQQENNEFYALLGHDLKSPHGTITSALHLIREQLADNSPAQTALDSALRTSARQMELLETLLSLRQLRAHALPVHREAVMVGPLMRAALDHLEPRAARKKIKLIPEWGEELPRVAVDPTIVARILVNLLENAYKFTPPHGVIKLGAQREAGDLWVTVGVPTLGLSAAEQRIVLDRYEQIMHSRSAQDGAGLGLVFCQLASQALGGELKVTDLAGEGIQFAVLFRGV